MATFETEIQPGLCVVHVYGDVSLESANHLRSVLQEAEAKTLGTVEVDLGDVEFIGSVGASVVIGAHERLRNQGRKLTIHHCSRRASRVFGLLHREDLLS
jgi:anti-anti-sigma factor